MKNKKKVFKPGNSDSWIERIRRGRGGVFVDPCPMPSPLGDLAGRLGKIFGGK